LHGRHDSRKSDLRDPNWQAKTTRITACDHRTWCRVRGRSGSQSFMGGRGLEEARCPQVRAGLPRAPRRCRDASSSGRERSTHRRSASTVCRRTHCAQQPGIHVSGGRLASPDLNRMYLPRTEGQTGMEPSRPRDLSRPPMRPSRFPARRQTVRGPDVELTRLPLRPEQCVVHRCITGSRRPAPFPLSALTRR
jgi:hypothetical protein